VFDSGLRVDIPLINIRKLIDAVTSVVISGTEELTTLDSAIGDADHGLNMKRGFEFVLADREKLSAMALPEALKAIGMTLVMKVGGASGPLYGTLFLTLGKELPAEPSVADTTRALEAAIVAMKLRGKAEVGNKTMLDVLAPVAAHLASGTATFDSVAEIASTSAEATIPMKATRGRASFLGDRSIGHMDPGSRSCSMMIASICDVLERNA
jgi:phosphoenolpyruvate---glycerone phosphotransferase subunit DhaL